MNSAPDQNTVADLWLKIDQLHLNFIKAEESTRKIDIRKRLEGFVHQYLCLVPQDRKFCSRLISEIIWQSARWTPNFSAVKAAAAFEAIEKYAANLLNQPWRKEFKEIKQYGGFYKHQVEGSLSGAEKMFHQMGYVSTGQETMVLGGPQAGGAAVDQDRVTTVARDCLLAYVECQIAVSIMQGVSAQFPCTWEEVLDFRRDHVGPPEQAVRALVYMKNQLQYQLQHQNHHHLPYGHVAAPTQGHVTNGYQPYGHARRQNGGVPTGTLVDVGNSPPPPPPDRPKREGQPPPLEQAAGVAWGAPIPLTIKQFEEEDRRKTMANGALDTWDQMRHGLNSSQQQQPSMSEAAAQLEALISKVGPEAARHILQNQAGQQQQQLTRQEQQQQQQLIRQHDQQHPNSFTRQESPQKHNSPPTPPPKSSRHARPLKPPAPSEAPPPALPQKRSRQRAAAGASQPPPPPPQESRGGGNKWECRACTFLNDGENKICSICAKSRDVGDTADGMTTPSEEYRECAGPPSDPSSEEEEEDGGDTVQCPKCTLFNDARLRACEACGASLHIAPLPSPRPGGSSSSSSSAAAPAPRRRRPKHR